MRAAIHMAMIGAWLLGGCVSTSASRELAPVAAPAPAAATNPATVPTSRENEPEWVALCNQIKGEIAAASHVDVLLLGDSIMQGWRRQPDLWARFFGCRHTVNGGIWSDGTQHLLWRLKNGVFAGADPRLVVMLIGTNNGGQTPFEIRDGVKADVDEALEQFPHAKVLVLGIFPMNADPESPQRQKRRAANRLIAELADGRRVFFDDIGYIFLAPGGTIPQSVMPDALHLSRFGFEMWGNALEPELRRLLAETP